MLWAVGGAVVLRAQGNGPTLTPAPAALTFNYQIGANLPAAQNVNVRISTGTPAYTVTVGGTNTQWLTVTPESGRMPAALAVRVNPTTLAAGTYTAAVIVAVTGVANPASIPVTLVVTSPPPTLTLSSAALNFTAPPVPAAQTVRLTTTGGPVTFTAAAGAPWMTVAPTSGVVLPGAPVTLSVAVDTATLTPQAAPFTGRVTITASGVAQSSRTQNIAVSLTLNPAQPTVTSIWPAGAQAGAAATTLTVRGTNFYKDTTIRVQGQTTPLNTTIISGTAALAVIPAPLLATAGTLNILASNPAPGGDSTATPFTVSANPVVRAVTNVASYSSHAVAPGMLVALFGLGIGPTTPVGMTDADNNGILDSVIGTLSVQIDGFGAPILYAGPDQVTVQVPYGAAMGPARSVTVQNGSVTATGTVDIIGASPGIFTLDSSGTGQAALLVYNATNQTYALNAGNAPARPGDTVVFYVTGEGDYATSITTRTGYIVPSTLNPLPQMNPLPTVTMGGQPAQVTYAGPMVGSVLGVLQINAVVPQGSATGNAVPLSVTISGASSQAGVTLVVRP